jgi:hypothetical protein
MTVINRITILNTDKERGISLSVSPNIDYQRAGESV